MATRVISTSIKLDGEAEFKKELEAVNRELKNLDGEMKLTTEEFKGQEKSAESLTKKQELLKKQVEQQTEKVKALERAVDESSGAFGDADRRTDAYRQSLNRAKTELVKTQRELDDTTRDLKQVKSGAKGAADGMKKFGEESKKASKAGDKNGFEDLAESLGKLKKLTIGGAVVAGIKEIGDAVLSIEEETREYRKIMGTLEVSSQKAGYSAEETAEAYDRLYGVLGDTQTAATTVANLQAIGLSQEDLMELVDAATGAWATYGDSIPLGSLAESINETIQASQVTGTFADVLTWAGSSEDEFNEKLANAKDASERANIVLEELAKQGLADTGQAWRDVNSDIVEANEAQANWDKAMGELGEALVPAATALRNWGADALGYVTEMVRNAISALQDLSEAMGTFFSGGADAKSANMVVDEAELAIQNAETYKTSQALATAGLVEEGWDSAALHRAAAQVVNGVSTQSAGSSTSTVKTAIYIDSREVAETITPAMRDYDKSNPEVKSDR